MRRQGDLVCVDLPLCRLASAFCARGPQDGRQAVCAALERLCPAQPFSYDPTWPCDLADSKYYAPFAGLDYEQGMRGGMGLGIYKSNAGQWETPLTA
jgi:hypothetical protein